MGFNSAFEGLILVIALNIMFYSSYFKSRRRKWFP